MGDIHDFESEKEKAREHLKRGAKAKTDKEKWMEAMNKRYAFVVVGGKPMVMDEGKGELKLLTPAAFKDRYCAGGREKSEGVTWYNSPTRRSYEGFIYAPEGNAPKGYYNLWKGFAVKEDLNASCQLYKDHLLEVICSGNREHYEYIWAWMAECVQNRSVVKPGTCICLKGEEGTGKSLFARLFGELFGDMHFQHATMANQIIGRFTYHLKHKSFVFIDEALFAGAKASLGSIYGLITEKTINVEAKGREMEQCPNFMRFMLASNHEHMAPIASSDPRRFAVFEVSSHRKGDRDYFDALNHQMCNEGGKGALLAELMLTNYKAVDLRTVPRTKVLTEQILHNAEPFVKYWYERLQAKAPTSLRQDWNLTPPIGFNDRNMAQLVPKRELTHDFQQTIKASGENPRSLDTQVGMNLRKYCREVREVRKKVEVPLPNQEHKQYPETEVRKERCWVFPEWEQCCQLMEEKLGHGTIEWGVEIEEEDNLSNL